MGNYFLEGVRDILLKKSVEEELREFIEKISKLEFCEHHNFCFKIKIINNDTGNSIDIIRKLNINDHEERKNET